MGMWYPGALLLVILASYNSISVVNGDIIKDYCEIDLSFKIICYYTNWAQYRPGIGKYDVSNVDPCLCTHIVFAFANINGLQLEPLEPNDVEMYGKMRDLKVKNADLRILISIGGDVVGMDPFIHISSTHENRVKFAENTLEYLNAHGLDGIDVDWEYPEPVHRDQFTELLREIKREFVHEAELTGRRQKQVAAAVGAGKYYIEGSYDIPAISSILDFVNLMTYDLHGGWEPFTGFHSALNGSNANDNFCQTWVVDAYLNRGLDPKKAMLGIPTYGRSYVLCNTSNHEPLDCAIGHGTPGPQTLSNGTLSYYEICRKKHMTKVYDQVQRVPYSYYDDLWVSYDDVQSVTEKKHYAIRNGLGGVMFWDVSVDDFDGHCGEGKYPLLRVFDPNSAAGLGDPHRLVILGLSSLVLVLSVTGWFDGSSSH